MNNNLTITEIKTIFLNYLVLTEDNNEQKRHISDYFKNRTVINKKTGEVKPAPIRTQEYPMITADYSFFIFPNQWLGNKTILDFSDKFLIERKSGSTGRGGGFQELRGNLTTGHKLFKAEFGRMIAVQEVILLLENATDKNCIKKVPPQQMSNETFYKIYDTFVQNRNKSRLELKLEPIKVEYCSLENAGETVMKLIFDFLVENFGKKKT